MKKKLDKNFFFYYNKINLFFNFKKMEKPLSAAEEIFSSKFSTFENLIQELNDLQFPESGDPSRDFINFKKDLTIISELLAENNPEKSAEIEKIILELEKIENTEFQNDEENCGKKIYKKVFQFLKNYFAEMQKVQNSMENFLRKDEVERIFTEILAQKISKTFEQISAAGVDFEPKIENKKLTKYSIEIDGNDLKITDGQKTIFMENNGEDIQILHSDGGFSSGPKGSEKIIKYAISDIPKNFGLSESDAEKIKNFLN